MSDDDLNPVRETIRGWASQPPRRSPRAARTRVMAHLESRKHRAARRVTVAAAAIILLLIVVPSLFDQGAPTRPNLEPKSRTLVIIELRSGTRLYIPMNSSAFDPASSTAAEEKVGQR